MVEHLYIIKCALKILLHEMQDQAWNIMESDKKQFAASINTPLPQNFLSNKKFINRFKKTRELKF
jgi:hypothetical protein